MTFKDILFQGRFLEQGLGRGKIEYEEETRPFESLKKI